MCQCWQMRFHDHPQMQKRSNATPCHKRWRVGFGHQFVKPSWFLIPLFNFVVVIIITIIFAVLLDMAMDQYLYIPFLGGSTSIYQLFWGSPGVPGFDTSKNRTVQHGEASMTRCCRSRLTVAETRVFQGDYRWTEDWWSYGIFARIWMRIFF